MLVRSAHHREVSMFLRQGIERKNEPFCLPRTLEQRGGVRVRRAKPLLHA